ncbi:hypothetical protein C490_03153 [Natronobacterium gregoryi SP2]|uniref:Uncharacterized protein n=1 Tax=Natronobacterium gregoryi (strain ATCC 43098 / DSM 3393 / CCM 3738 / CIP 104747 / IAM 13177 / JCM 8860 / NBRC 102187 / NCIMB 2189 / SP2) TaxID=797304 RepID=L9YHY9_NATGS|nr:hypothetical protein C490_03153 [Natronobacterium gregoryi SP2]
MPVQNTMKGFLVVQTLWYLMKMGVQYLLLRLNVQTVAEILTLMQPTLSAKRLDTRETSEPRISVHTMKSD